MARKSSHVDDHGSRREFASSVKSKVDQVKKEKVKQEKSKARAVSDDEEQSDVPQEDDEQGSGVEGDDVVDEVDELAEDDEDDDASAKGSKRVRVNADGHSVPGTADVGKGKAKARTITLPRDDDGFIPGSIVRIQLRNFVTYDWVEFRPGPYLNMILGPNGTGKSSIACAICLGLNWSPSVLGRASELNSFVKNNTDDGHIEIELKGPRGQGNLTIRRNLIAKSKGSTFTLNGAPAAGREITTRMAELNVQVGNLCSFLPQDKVSEFAAMSPQQLLRETQRAAGDENLTNWHNTLISSGKELKQLQEHLTIDRACLKTMQERNAILERDVERYNERRRIEHEIEMLGILIPVQEYREIRARYMETKAQQRALHEKVARLKEKNYPLHNYLKKLADKYKELSETRDAKKKAAKQKFDKMKAKWAQSEQLDTEAEDTTLKLENLKKNEKDRVKRIKNLEVEIAKITSELKTPVETEKMEDINDDLRQLNLEHHDTLNRQADLQDRQKKNIDDISRHNAEIGARMKELQNLDDANVRKLQELERWDRDCYDGILWLRKEENRRKFRMQVFEPPLVSLTVPDRRFTNAVEACFNVNQLKTFVTQCREDYIVLNNCINDSEGLGRKARINTWFRPKIEDSIAGPPLTHSEMANLNFDGYAINYVSCPDGLLWFLKKDLNLHRTAIGLDGNKIDVTDSMQAVSRYEPNGLGGGANFVAGNSFHMVQRSRYGKKLAQNMTRDVRPARNLVNSTIDPEVKRRIDQSIADARNALKELEQQSTALSKEDASIRAEDKQFQTKLAAINARKKAVTDAASRLVTLTSKLARSEERLQKELDAPSIEVERSQLKKRLFDMSKKRVKIAKEYTELVRGSIKDQVETTKVGIKYLQVGANKAALEELSREKDAEYRDALLEFTKVDEAYNAIKEKSKAVLADSRQKVFGIEPELRAEYEEIEHVRSEYEKACKVAEEQGTTPPPSDGVELRTMDELRAELETQQANLEMNLNTNPGVVEQYEKRKKEIEALTHKIETAVKKSQKIERAIKNARDNWQPALERLVQSIGQKFSAAFDRIGCAGEIRISQHEDYDKWAIDILVTFRSNEKLQLLTGQRQSGGERSLSTIMYLMSLTEEARAPFSLVDEINQGMDQEYERNVHNSMVEVTCKPDSAQYFLITPKLLADLKYHERMKILCVNNGEWLPEERDMGNMMNMIEAVVQRRTRSNAAA